MDTRGTESNITAIQAKDKGFGVFGNYTASDGTTPTYGKNLFENQQVTYSSTDSKWTYSPVKYWPTKGHIDFLAYAPHDDKQVLKNNKELDFTVNSDVTKQIDLLWDNAAKKTKTTEKVKFTFKHALAKIGYSVKSKANYSQTTITVKSIKLVGDLADENINAFYTKGTIDLSKGNNDKNLWTIADDVEKQDFNWFTGSQNLTADAATNNDDNNNLFVIPQNFSTSENKLFVVVEYTVKTGNTEELQNKVSKPITKDFMQGKAYMINLKIGLTPIEFEAEVSLWPDAENIDGIEWN